MLRNLSYYPALLLILSWATAIALEATAEEKPFFVARLDVGLDTTAACEAFVKVAEWYASPLFGLC